MANKIVALVGPTAVGKTEIALSIAKDMDMEIVSCDSMQLYKYMDIGSAKPTKDELASVPHHMIDVINPLDYAGSQKKLLPEDFFSVAKYKKMAESALDDIISNGKTPLIVGGTGLYLDSLIYEIDFAASPSDEDLRDELYEIAENNGAEYLHNILMDLDPESAERIHPNNIKRVVRAIESAKLGDTIKEYNKSFKNNEKYTPVLIGLTRDRGELYDRINKRVDSLMEKGLLDEVKGLADQGLTSDDYPMKGIGYKELMDYLDGKYSLEDAITAIKTNSRHYAKRQFTWFKKYEDMKWFDLTGKNDEELINIIDDIEKWLKTKL